MVRSVAGSVHDRALLTVNGPDEGSQPSWTLVERREEVLGPQVALGP